MSEEPAPAAPKLRRVEAPVLAVTAKAIETVPAPTTASSSSGGGWFGKLVLLAVVIGLIQLFQSWRAEQRAEQARRQASDQQVMEFLGFGAKAALQGLFSSPSKPPQDIGPYNPALRSPPPPRVERETTTLYDNNNNPVGKAYTTREVPAR